MITYVGSTSELEALLDSTDVRKQEQEQEIAEVLLGRLIAAEILGSDQ